MDRNQIKDENGGGSARTSLPYGLCKKYGIALPANATPHDAWEALKGKGISPKAEYEKLKSQKRSELEGKYDSEKKWVVTKEQNDARIAAQEKANKPLIEDTKKKAIDLLQVADSGYNDPSKVSVKKSPKGNWIINYDGKNTGIVVGADQFNENDLKIDGILEGAPSFKGSKANAASNFDDDLAAAYKKHGGDEDAILEELRATGRDYGMSNSDLQGAVEGYVMEQSMKPNAVDVANAYVTHETLLGKDWMREAEEKYGAKAKDARRAAEVVGNDKELTLDDFKDRMKRAGVQTASKKDNSPRGYSTVSVEDIKEGDEIILDNHFVKIGGKPEKQSMKPAKEEDTGEYDSFSEAMKASKPEKKTSDDYIKEGIKMMNKGMDAASATKNIIALHTLDNLGKGMRNVSKEQFDEIRQLALKKGADAEYNPQTGYVKFIYSNKK